MLRITTCNLEWRASMEFDRARTLFRGRARLERKIGVKQLLFLLRIETKYRTEMKSFWERSIVRKNVDSAAQEHGSGWIHLKNDLARQNVMLLPRAQQIIAQYEPLSFRAVMELCASRIPPPPPPLTAQVPEEAYLPLTSLMETSTSKSKLHEQQKEQSLTEARLSSLQKCDNNTQRNCPDRSEHKEEEEQEEEQEYYDALQVAHPAARRELREGVERMLRISRHGILKDKGPSTISDWMNVWKEYEVNDTDTEISNTQSNMVSDDVKSNNINNVKHREANKC